MKYEYGSLQWNSVSPHQWRWNNDYWTEADNMKDHEALGLLGEQRWELVSVVTHESWFIYYFKRPSAS